MAANYSVTYTINAVGNLKEQSKFAEKINKELQSAATVGSKAAGKALEQSRSKAAEFGDYRKARGFSEDTRASARDFSRESQGLGGLVRTYATFAANIFAATLAFEQFKKAFEFQQLQRASEVFAVTLGKNIGGLAKDLSELTQGAITAKAAQQIANYGSSAGLTADQLRRLVVVAKGASAALGRDLGDSVDRLIRGVGKLEPELLDELGILTRTQIAGEKYAASVGKTFLQLTQFEKVQAFTNAVLEEGERKFSAVSKAVDASPFEKFSAALSNVATKMFGFLNTALVPILDFFAKNPIAMITALGLAIVKLATMAIPALKNIGVASYEAADSVKRNLLAINNAADDAVSALESRRKSVSKHAFDVKMGDLDTVKAQIRNRQEELIKAVAAGPVSGVDAFNKEIERRNKELVGLVAERKRIVEELRSERPGRLASRQPEPISREARTELARAMSEVVKQEGIISSQLIAQQFGLKKGFEQLSYETKKFSDNRKELLSSITSGNKLLAVTETLNRSVAVSTMYLSGAFKILTASVAGVVSTIGTWLGAIGLIAAAITAVISVTGGFNEKIGELESAQEGMNKNLQNSAAYIKEYGDRIIEAAKGTGSLFEVISYSSNVFTGLVDGLEKSNTAFKEFVNNTGYATDMWQKFKGLFGGGVVNDQIAGLKKTIITALATVDAADKDRVTQAILKALPGSKDINDALNKLTNIDDKNILSIVSDKIISGLKQVEPTIKNQASIVKSVEEAWSNLGKEVDKYNDKTDKIAKDPKLEKTVAAFDTIINAVQTAGSEQEKLNLLSLASADIITKIKSLEDNRTESNKDLIKALEAVKLKEQDILKQKAEQVKLDREAEVLAARRFSISKGVDLVNKQQSMAKDIGAPITIGLSTTSTNEIQNRQERLKDWYQDSLQQIIKLKESAAKAGNAKEVAGFEQLTTELTSKYEDWNTQLKQLADKNAAAVGSSAGAIFIDDFSAKLMDGLPKLEAIMSGFFNSMNKKLGTTYTPEQYSADLAREMRVMKETNLGGTSEEEKALAKLIKERNRIAALESNKPGTATKTPKLSMEYELQIKLINAQIAANKILEDQEKNILGYVTQQTLANEYNLRVALENANNKKEIAEIDRRLQEDEKRKSAESISNHSRSLDIQKLIHQTNLDRLKIDFERDKVLAASLANEKNILAVKTQILDIESSIIDNLRESELIPQRIVDKSKTQLEFDRQLLDIQKQRNILETKRLDINTSSSLDKNRIAELTAGVDIEEQILISKEKELEIQKEINNLISDYRSYLAEIVKSEEVLSNSLDLQLNSYNYISSISERLLTAEKLKESIITSQASKYVAFANATENADTKRVALLNTVLEIENKLLEVRQKSYELNAKSNENINATISEGVDLAIIDANKKVPGIAKAVVDGVTNGISNAVDYLFDKIKSREKIAVGDIINALGSGIKDVVFDAIASKLKASLLELLSPNQQNKGINDLKITIENEINRLREHEDAIISSINTQQELIIALENNTTAINNSTSGRQDIPNSNFGFAFKDFNTQIKGSTEGISDLADIFGKTDYSVQGLSDSFLSCTASSDELQYSSSYAAAANANLANASVNAANTLNQLPNILSGISGGSGNATGGIVGTVTKGFDILSKGFSLFSGETIGKTIGSVLGPELTASIASAIPGIGWVTAAASFAYSLFKKQRGGEKVGGYGSVGNVPSTQERYFTPSSQDSDITKILKQQQTDFTSLLTLVGGKSGGVGFNLGYDTDPKGTAPNRMQAGVYIDGKLVYESIKSDLGRDQEKLNEEIATETKRGILAALKSSDLPENIANYFKDLTSEIISNLTSEQADVKLDMATILGSIAKNRDEYARIFGEDIYNITEEVISGLSTGTEKLSETFNTLRDEFTATNVLIRNLGVSAETAFGALGLSSAESRRELLSAAGGLEKFSTLVSFYTDNFITDQKKFSLAMSIANNTLNEGFAALNITIPKTIDEFNSLMISALDAKTGSAELTAELLRLAPAFAEIMAVNEKFTELFKMTNFKLSNPVLTAKNAVGNAARQAFITATGGLEKFTEKTAFYMGELFSAAEQHTRIFYSASDTLREGFSKLGTSIPATAAEFNNLVAAAMNMGEAGADLFGKLMDLAPAFDTVINSIDSTKSAIHDMAGSFISDIEDTIYTEQQRYEKYQALAQKQIDYLDSLERMTPEELKRSGVTETTIQEAGTKALEAIKSTWSNLQPEVQVSYGQDYIRTVTELDTSLGVLLDRLRPITNIEGVSSISDTGTDNSTQSTEQDIANALDTVIQKNNSFWDGLAKALNDVVDRFGIAAANMGTAADNMYIATTTPQNINVAVNLEGTSSREVG